MLIKSLLTLTTAAFLAAASLTAAEVDKGVVARTVSVVQVPSDSLGAPRPVSIIVPVDYQNSTRRYPVLYLLHGYGDNNSAWSIMTNISGYAARYGLIIVMPDALRSFYINSATDPKSKFDDFMVKDLVPYIDAHYRSIPLPRARAVAGLSMGGYGAAFLGLKHFDTFSAVGSFSGALAIARETPVIGSANSEESRSFEREMQSLFGPVGSAGRKERDPFALLEKVPAPQMPMLYIACGGQDFLLRQNRDFVALLAAKNIPYEYREVSPRVHSWDFWDDQIRLFLGLLAHTPGFDMAMPAPVPRPPGQ